MYKITKKKITFNRLYSKWRINKLKLKSKQIFHKVVIRQYLMIEQSYYTINNQ